MCVCKCVLILYKRMLFLANNLDIIFKQISSRATRIWSQKNHNSNFFAHMTNIEIITHHDMIVNTFGFSILKFDITCKNPLRPRIWIVLVESFTNLCHNSKNFRACGAQSWNIPPGWPTLRFTDPPWDDTITFGFSILKFDMTFKNPLRPRIWIDLVESFMNLVWYVS